jgi:hypothetical protein
MQKFLNVVGNDLQDYTLSHVQYEKEVYIHHV